MLSDPLPVTLESIARAKQACEAERRQVLQVCPDLTFDADGHLKRRTVLTEGSRIGAFIAAWTYGQHETIARRHPLPLQDEKEQR